MYNSVRVCDRISASKDYHLEKIASKDYEFTSDQKTTLCIAQRVPSKGMTIYQYIGPAVRAAREQKYFQSAH